MSPIDSRLAPCEVPCLATDCPWTCALNSRGEMTSIQELIDEGLIKLTPVMVSVEEAQLVSVSCEDFKCGKGPDFCDGGCPNWDPHDIPLSEIPEELREFFDDQTSRRLTR